MTEMGTQILITKQAWERMPDVRAKAEDALRKNLELAGCHSIRVEEPRYEWFAPDPDSEAQWEPYWAWEINAFGERDA